MHFLAPAKINLHLRIGPPRGDGFHPLLSWMTTIGLFDRLTLVPSDSGQIALTCNEPALPCDERNLVVKAARLLSQMAPHNASVNSGVSIHLEKKIPHGGGLGGGSSDAASTLLGLNAFWHLEKNIDELDLMAARLGSDINFFLHGPSSVCRGRGEVVRPIAVGIPRWVVLILPALQMPTPAVYRKFDQLQLGRDEDVNQEPDWPQWTALGSEALLIKFVNDLEIPAFAIEPRLAVLRAEIEQALSRPVRMSGSGSSLFTLYDLHHDAASAAKLITDRHACQATAVQLCPESRLPHD